MTWNPRYIAYAQAHGRTPEEQAKRDRKAYGGARLLVYVAWVTAKWREWEKLTGHRGAHTEADHAAFDAWLAARPV